MKKVTDYANEQFRQGVAVVLVKKGTNQIFFAMRTTDEGDLVTDPKLKWTMPQGGLDEGEAPWDTLVRELEEEIGVLPNLIKKVQQHPEEQKFLFVPLVEPCKWVGQAHRWYLCEFLGEDEDINLNHRLPAEFAKFEWTTAEDVVARANPQQKVVYENVLTYFGLL